MNAQDLQQLDELLSRRLDEKLRNFATKDDLKKFATKDDISSTEKRLEQKIKEVETRLTTDIKETEVRLTKVITREAEDLGDLIGEGFKGLDAKADKSETLSLRVRVDKLEEKVFPN